MKKYEEYLEANVMGISEIPKHWYTTKINYFTSIRTGGTPHKENNLYWNNGTINWMSSGEVNKEFVYATNNKITEEGMLNSNANLLPINSVMMALNGQGKTKGMVAVLKVESTCNQSLAAFICDEIHLNYLYLYYFLKSRYKEIRGLVGDGLRDGISIGLLKSLRICIPPFIEQIQISTYLNQKVNEINLLIKQKEILISTLAEKRQAIITETVTKGLNSNVKMKASGIEWIDGIPEHWVVKRVKHIAAKGKYSLVDGPFGSDLKNEEYKDEGVPLIQLNNIRNGEHLFNNIKYVTEEKAQNLGKHTAAPGDLVVAKMAHPVGRSAIVSSLFKKYVIVADCIKLSLDENYCNKFINYAMNTPYFISQAELVAGGITRLRINLGELKQLKVFIPPYQEQLLICKYLDEKVKEIDNCTDLVKDQIQKLKEYRQSLIYEAVTGKIDVREFETAQ